MLGRTRARQSAAVYVVYVARHKETAAAVPRPLGRDEAPGTSNPLMEGAVVFSRISTEFQHPRLNAY
jgi:hypothetical protein